MNRFVRSAVLSWFVFVLGIMEANGQPTAMVDFESISVGTVFGGTNGGTNMPGDLIFTQNGIDVSVETNVFGSFNSVVVGGFSGSAFPTTPATISNINLMFDFSNLAFDVTQVTFEFADFGGEENLGVNGTVLELANLPDAPATLGGASVAVVPDGSGIGMVTITGNINSVTVGGQEFGLDNVVATGVPEPSTMCLLLLTALTASLQRTQVAGQLI